MMSTRRHHVAARAGVQPGKYQSRREKRDKAEAQDVDKPDCVERVSASVFFSLPEFHPPQGEWLLGSHDQWKATNAKPSKPVRTID